MSNSEKAEGVPESGAVAAATEAPTAEVSSETPAAATADPASATATNTSTSSLIEAFKSNNQTAFIVGSTGECGKALVRELARTKIFSKVILIGRREVKLEDDVFKDFAVEQRLVDFDNLDASADIFNDVTVGYSCLGTTRAKSGVEGYRKVDLGYAMKVATLAKEHGCKQYHLVSTPYANTNSMLVYGRIKGQVEEEMTKLGFDKLTIYKPGGLICKREEPRFGEWLAGQILKPINALSPGSLTNTTVSVAQSMVLRTIKPGEKNLEFLDGKEIHRASKELLG